MDPSKPQKYPKNLSTRWKARSDRKLAGPETFLARKSRTRRADMKPLSEVQRNLAARYLPLARALARPLKQMFSQWNDEFESAACLALVEAARSFDPERNIQFATFARFRIRGALVDVGRVMGLAGFEEDPEEAPSAGSLTPYSEEHGKVLVANKPPRVGSEFDDIDAVEHMLKKLPKKHATVCRMLYLYGKTQAEIGEMIGCSQTEVTRVHLKALEFLSEPYHVEGTRNQSTWKRRTRSGRKPKPSQVGGSDPAVA